MKTLVKNNDPFRDKIKKKRRKLNHTVKSQKKLSEDKKPDFVLSQKDYQDIIDIKKVKAKRLNQNSELFFSIGLAFTLLVVNILFNWRFMNAPMVDLALLQNAEFDEMFEVPNTEQPPPEPPKILTQPKVVVVPDEQILDQLDFDMDVEITEEMVIEQVNFDEMANMEEEVAEEIFQIVEQNPEPKGGYKAFYAYVNENIKYPDVALRMDISGKVFVKFVVDKEGNVTNVEAVKGIGGGCDEEAVRIVAESPKWDPGKQRGRPVSVYMMLPITFILH